MIRIFSYFFLVPVVLQVLPSYAMKVPLKNELFRACKAYDVKKVRAALALNVPVNDYDALGFTPLLYACTFNYLLSKPAFLIARALDRQQEIVALLLQAGADANQSSCNGLYTPLSVATYGIDQSGHLYNKKIVALLKQYKAVDIRLDIASVDQERALVKNSRLTYYLDLPPSFFELMLHCFSMH